MINGKTRKNTIEITAGPGGRVPVPSGWRRDGSGDGERAAICCGHPVVIIADEIIFSAATIPSSIQLNVAVNITSNNTSTLNGNDTTSMFVVRSTGTAQLSFLEFVSGFAGDGAAAYVRLASRK